MTATIDRDTTTNNTNNTDHIKTVTKRTMPENFLRMIDCIMMMMQTEQYTMQRDFFLPPLVEEEEENRTLTARRKTLSVLFYFCNLARNENEARV